MEIVYDYIVTLDEKGFENEKNKFKIMATGFPPKELQREDKIRAIFGESDSEAINVQELYD